MIIGSDFDNTIVDYRALFHQCAFDLGYVDIDFPMDKTLIRDHVRTLPNGEILWQKLQAVVYGERINEAVFYKGFMDFVKRCEQNKLKLYVVSHKTKYAKHGDIDLHKAALDFLQNKSVFGSGEYGLSLDRVFFSPTRTAKNEKIADLSCDVFIDDLIEVFKDDSFPKTTIPFLFNSSTTDHDGVLTKLKVISSWAEFSNSIFKSVRSF